MCKMDSKTPSHDSLGNLVRKYGIGNEEAKGPVV